MINVVSLPTVPSIAPPFPLFAAHPSNVQFVIVVDVPLGRLSVPPSPLPLLSEEKVLFENERVADGDEDEGFVLMIGVSMLVVSDVSPVIFIDVSVSVPPDVTQMRVCVCLNAFSMLIVKDFISRFPVERELTSQSDPYPEWTLKAGGVEEEGDSASIQSVFAPMVIVVVSL